MQLARHTHALRRGAALVALLVVACASALTLTQCRMVNERLTGVTSFSLSTDKCLMACASAYNDSIRAESNLHKVNVHTCGSDPVCQAIENARHDAAVNRIQTGRAQCQSDCHHQGGGTGGV